MKIYFSGSHGSGKTTCARYVANKYNLPFISEVARMVLSEQELQVDTLRYDIALVDKYQTQVFHRQLEEEAKFEAFVSDRSAMDAMAYAGQHSRVLSQLTKSFRLVDYISVLKDPGSIYFFVRPSRATLKPDGVREALNWDAVVAIDAQIKLLLEMFEIPYFQINTDSMQERVRIIDSILSVITNNIV
jgi:predicted ATPase